MAQNFGTGVSRVLDPQQGQITQVIWQEGKPPLDSELNLLQQLATDARQIIVSRGTPSGWLGNETDSEEAYETDADWSNWFRFGQQRTGEKAAIQWAVVNGWMIPVTGTLTGSPPGSPDDTSTWNRVTLSPPPSNSGDSRIDFVFLEVWLARIPPNPSTLNKPSSSALYRYGNVEGGYSFLSDDLQDPAIGFETTQRAQLQYRIRVVSGLVGLTSYPDGFDPAVVKARGASTTDTSFAFTNMRSELGDPGLWRAGDGTSNALGTVDGYSYAIPIATVFRRNSVAWDGDPGQNLNGAFNRNPTAIDRTGYTTFTTVASLASGITDTATTLTLASASGIPLPTSPASAVYVKVGDEVLTYTSITGTTMNISSRGALGTKAETHLAGDTVTLVAIRPDGLFADQVAKTDILDLRHVVNPNGFDYDTLLKGALDSLMRGNLQSNWKRSGGGPQGKFVFYQDKISASAAALGVTKLDAPDNIRRVFSDAVATEVVTGIFTPASTGDATTAWEFPIEGTQAPGDTQWNANDTLTVPIDQFRTSMPGSDLDQVRFDTNNMVVALDGDNFPLIEGVDYTVSPTPETATYSDDLVITLGSGFTPTDRRLIVTFALIYGPGRGLSRRPDAVHSVAYLNASTRALLPLKNVPANNTPLSVSWLPLWSKIRAEEFNNLIPVTAGAFIDPGSRTVVLNPFRAVEMPTLRVLDGEGVNRAGADKVTGTSGSSSGTNTFTANAGVDLTGVVNTSGDFLLIEEGPAAGRYAITGRTANTVVVSGTIPTAVTVSFVIYEGQGLMPLAAPDGSAKWTQTDPLSLFSSGSQTESNLRNLYIRLPGDLVPGWGAVHVPIVHSDLDSPTPAGNGTFDEGINFGILTTKGDRSSGPNTEKNFVPFDNGGGQSATFFSTVNFSASTISVPPTPSTIIPVSYNAQGTGSSVGVYAGMRFFSDSRDLGREGLELPPFYGIARLYAVYEAVEFAVGTPNGSAYNSADRTVGSGATNLLRQDFDGPVFWIEVDDDGDATFVLNAEAIDISKATFNPITSFSSGNYVIEASIFGFDRGAFSRGHSTVGGSDGREVRLVLTRERLAGQADNSTRSENYGTGTAASIDGPSLVVPAPANSGDSIAINYSRTVYQGDAWGSQQNQTDIQHLRGPLTTANEFQLTSTELDEGNLTRPNEKVLEVLSSIGFATTLGTGRYAGDALLAPMVGFEDKGSFPPATASDPRPNFSPGALNPYESVQTLGTVYHGCTERLPLGGLFRDKDFRGGFVGVNTGLQQPLVYFGDQTPGVLAGNLSLSQSLEQTEVAVNTASIASGQPQEVVVHVDGEQGNFSILTNYRTTRGGSAFSATAPRPGGELASFYGQAGTSGTFASILTGTAYLVRNTPTNVGATEVSAGSELMMLVVTTAHRLGASGGTTLSSVISTSGTREGYSAADLYRLPGRPVVRDNVRIDIDPSLIELSRKVNFSSSTPVAGPVSAGGIGLSATSEPPTPTEEAIIWLDVATGKIRVKFPNGTIIDIAG